MIYGYKMLRINPRRCCSCIGSQILQFHSIQMDSFSNFLIRFLRWLKMSSFKFSQQPLQQQIYMEKYLFSKLKTRLQNKKGQRELVTENWVSLNQENCCCFEEWKSVMLLTGEQSLKILFFKQQVTGAHRNQALFFGAEASQLFRTDHKICLTRLL